MALVEQYRERIPVGITRKHILAAIQALDGGVEHKFGRSTFYDVLHNGRRYPPKAVIGLAAGYLTGTPLGPYDFKGGLQTICFRTLRQNGFDIITKGETTPYPDEVEPLPEYWEGALERVTVNRYERDPGARKKCIDHHGAKCSVCDFDFEQRYGTIGAGFIHVHHVVLISSVGKRYVVNPLVDLSPVCPNCHAMLHRRSPPFSIQELRTMLAHPNDLIAAI